MCMCVCVSVCLCLCVCVCLMYDIGRVRDKVFDIMMLCNDSCIYFNASISYFVPKCVTQFALFWMLNRIP